jgi:uncharacterized membrane protein
MVASATALRWALGGALGAGALLARWQGLDGTAAALVVAALAAALAPPRRSRILLFAGVAAGAATLILLVSPAAGGPGLRLLPALGMLVLAWHFGATLRHGEEPLITRYIREDFRGLPEGCEDYGRALTRFWTFAFLGFTALNLLPLAGVLSPEVAGGATVAASFLFFLGEHGWRAQRFPHLPVGPGRTLRAIWRASLVRHAR